MNKLFGLFVSVLSCIALSGQVQSDYVPLKELFKKDFLIGVAVNSRSITGDAGKFVTENFNTMTCENEMKPQSLLYFPRQSPMGAPQAPIKLDTINGLVFNWAAADRIVAFAKANNMMMRGHTLVWYQQTPAAFFTNAEGKDLTKDQLYARLRVYMTAVMTHFKDAVFCWDVVNEAISDNEGEIYRTNSPWYRICGKDYVGTAFRIARSVNPNVKLVYNDYNLVNPAKLERACTMLKELLDAGVPIDAVGLQGHWSNDITAEMLQTLIDRITALGVKIQITELDVTTYTSYHGDGAKHQVQETQPYTKQVEDNLSDSYKRFFEVLHKNAGKITSVTFWGLDDGRTWLSGFPVRGRTDYPLLFDKELKPKKAYYSVKSVYMK